MKILHLGHGGENAKDRISALQMLGHHVVRKELYPKSKSLPDVLMRRWAAHFQNGPWIEEANENLNSRMSRWNGFDLIWIEKALYLKSETIDELRLSTGTPILHYTPDVALEISGTQRSKLFEQAIPKYDLLVTTKDFEVASYKLHGANVVILTDQAVSSQRFYPRPKLRPAQKCEIGFIGHYERHYFDILKDLHVSGLPVEARGPGWNSWLNRIDPRMTKVIQGGSVRGEAYPQRLSGMKVGLGLLGKLGADVITTRSFEIPACGTFLLAERTDMHQEVFKEGVHAEYFGSFEELEDKATYYLNHSKQRDEIAACGLQKFLDSPFRLDRQMKHLMDQVLNSLVL